MPENSSENSSNVGPGPDIAQEAPYTSEEYAEFAIGEARGQAKRGRPTPEGGTAIWPRGMWDAYMERIILGLQEHQVPAELQQRVKKEIEELTRKKVESGEFV
jgi:hypothetical protein